MGSKERGTTISVSPFAPCCWPGELHAARQLRVEGTADGRDSCIRWCQLSERPVKARCRSASFSSDLRYRKPRMHRLSTSSSLDSRCEFRKRQKGRGFDSGGFVVIQRSLMTCCYPDRRPLSFPSILFHLFRPCTLCKTSPIPTLYPQQTRVRPCAVVVST